MRNDFSLTRNLAAEQPAKLKEMQALFMKEAEKYNVLPLDDRTIERTNPTLAGRPDVMGDRTSLTLYEGMQGMLENTFMNIKNRSSKITAELDIPADGANGAILSQGGRFGGWSLYMKDGKPAYTYNFLGLARYTVAAPQALASGPATVILDFAYDGGGVGKGGKATLSVNGKSVAEGRVEKTQPNIFSADETADVGIDNQTPVAEGIGIGPETRFTGKINKITLEVTLKMGYATPLQPAPTSRSQHTPQRCWCRGRQSILLESGDVKADCLSDLALDLRHGGAGRNATRKIRDVRRPVGLRLLDHTA